jgi:hypothetical protein
MALPGYEIIGSECVPLFGEWVAHRILSALEGLIFHGRNHSNRSSIP